MGGVARPESDRTNNLHVLLEVARRRWLTLLGCTVLVLAAAVTFSVLQQPKYTASASLLFSDTQFDQQLFGSNFTSSVDDPTQEQATNIDLASLPIVAGRTAQALRLSTGQVTSELSVTGVGQSNIAKISVTDADPVRAARIANTYVEQFVLYRQQADRSKITGAQTLVDRELAALPTSQRYGSVGSSLQERSNQLGVLAALQTGNAEVAQPAGVPGAPSTPNTRRNAVLGALLGLLLGVLAVFVTERLDRRIHGVSELEAAFGMPVLGAVPSSRTYTEAGVQPLPSVEAEAFALLRARMRYFNVDREIRSLLLTSSYPGEGKTTVALNLAIADAFAGNERSVVVIEADLRRPTLATRLGLPPGPGMSEILSRNASLDEALCSVEVPGRGRRESASFSLIHAGAVPPNPAELIESRAMIDLLSALSERFELIIIDTPPLTAVSDAIPLLRLVGGVIVVSRADRMTRDAAQHLRDSLEKLRAPVLGVVANAVVHRSSGYGYGDDYWYSNAYLSDQTEELASAG